MPTYEYACESCGHQFERFQSITARPLKKCPVCGVLQLRRLIGAGSGVIFKGSGFYQTDYRSEAYKKAAEADKTGGTASTAGKGDSQTGDGKPKKPSAESTAAKTESTSGKTAKSTADSSGRRGAD